MRITVNRLTLSGDFYEIHGYLSDNNSQLSDFLLSNGVIRKEGDCQWRGYGTIGTSTPERALEYAKLIQACYTKMRELEGNPVEERYAIVRYEGSDFKSVLLETGSGEQILDVNSGEYWNFADNKWGFGRNG
jgi:hypothetical protein